MKYIIYYYCAVVLCFCFSPEIIVGQQLPNIRTTPRVIESFDEVAKRVTLVSKGSMSLLRTHEDGSAHILVGNTVSANALFDPSSAPDKQTVSSAVLSMVQNILATALALPAEAEWQEEGTVHSENIWASSYSVSYNGIPLRERYINVTTGAMNGKVMLVRSNIPTLSPNISIPLVTGDYVFSKAGDDLGSKALIPTILVKEPSLVYVHIYETQEIRLAYEFEIREGDLHYWRYTYDAVNGSLIEKKDMDICNLANASTSEATFNDMTPGSDIAGERAPMQQASPTDAVAGTISAKVHLHSPTDTLSIVRMPFEIITVNSTGSTSDTIGSWSSPSASFPATITSTFNSAYQRVFRMDSKPNGALSSSASSGPVSLLWDDSNSDVAERDAYYSVAKIRDHDLVVDKGLTALKSQKIKINVNLNQTCNAFYQAADISLNFFIAGGGCTNTAEINDVVYHEFGHRVAHARYAAANAPRGNIVNSSLGEGFADLNSAFARSDARIGIGFFGKNTTLRTVDNKNVWPKNVDSQDPHMNGLMIGGAMWDVSKLIGVPIAEHLYHFCMYQKPDGIDVFKPVPLLDAFTEVLMAVLATDDDNNDLTDGTPHASQILQGFQLHNIGVPQFMNIRPQIVGDFDANANGYPVSVNATYTGPVGSLDKSSMKIHYSFDGKTYIDLPLADAGNNLYTGMIPKAPSGTVVRYYASAGMNYSDVTPVNYPTATEPLAFLVGFNSRYLDDAEKNNGWSPYADNDPNTTGGWDRDVPYGTYTVDGQFIQQDSDHTANGQYCYLTGNANSGVSRDPLLDCIDTGKVTLTTGTLDLSAYTDPYIRYWYYFRNDVREISSLPNWTVQISNNDGTKFTNIQTTTSYTQGWFPFVIRLKDAKITPTATMKLRFIPNNIVRGTCVEAGVDDIEVLEGIPANGVGDANMILQSSLGIPYPNPVSGSANLTVPFRLAEDQKCSLLIMDVLGNTVYHSPEEMFRSGNNNYVISPERFPADGIYTLELIGQNKIGTQKISVIRER